MSGRTNLLGPLAALVIGTGCALGPPEVGPAQEVGPVIALVVTNRTDGPHRVGYDFVADGGSGAGEGEVAPCDRTVMQFGGVAGSYQVTVDGEEVTSGEVPRGAREDFYLVFSIEIDEDGSATAGGPDLVRQPPPDRPAALEGCG